ncbi:LPXTG cell wall anchor domain-containing protein [Streptococcus castoreus]|uniref:LPXTG cell wall anchor domain-containing protein n=1 Tax=Streptococcus castoreus TaxID=254786 RepID=UPI0003F4FC61|nr:LPXTG cell wall anchor domain-containing protein [Streptococcus castoreus]
MLNKKVCLASIIVLATLSCGSWTITADQLSMMETKVEKQMSPTESALPSKEEHVMEDQTGESTEKTFEDFPEASQIEKLENVTHGQFSSSQLDKSVNLDNSEDLKPLPIRGGESDNLPLEDARVTCLPTADDQLDTNPTPHMRSSSSSILRYMIAKHNLFEKMEAFNSATAKFTTMMAQKSDLTTQVYSVGDSFGEVMAAYHEKKQMEQSLYKTKYLDQTIEKPSAIIDELGRLISYIGGYKKDISIPYNRKVSMVVTKKKITLPATRDKSSMLISLLGITSLVAALFIKLRKSTN